MGYHITRLGALMHRRSLTAAGQFILATMYLNVPPFDELHLHVAVDSLLASSTHFATRNSISLHRGHREGDIPSPAWS